MCFLRSTFSLRTFAKFNDSLFLSLSMDLSIHSSISRSPFLSSQFHEVQPLIMDDEEDVLFTDVPDTAPPPKKEEEPPAFAKKEKAKVQRSAATPALAKKEEAKVQRSAATPALAKKEKAKVQRSAAPGADQRTKKVLEPALEKIVEVEKIVTKEVPVDRLVVVEVPIKRALCVCVCVIVCVRACLYITKVVPANRLIFTRIYMRVGITARNSYRNKCERKIHCLSVCIRRQTRCLPSQSCSSISLYFFLHLSISPFLPCPPLVFSPTPHRFPSKRLSRR